jgi:hypothetical protein
MGEGARHDVLEDKIDYLNYEKNVRSGALPASVARKRRLMTLCIVLGATIKRKLIVALDELETQAREYKEMSKSIKKDTKVKWTRIAEEWAADKSKPNPYILLEGKDGALTGQDSSHCLTNKQRVCRNGQSWNSSRRKSSRRLAPVGHR